MERSLGRGEHRVAWLRPSSRFSLASQVAAVGKHKPHATYSAADDETIWDVVRHLVRTNVLIVAGLHRVAETRQEILDVMQAIRQKGALLFDAETESFVDVGAIESVLMAIGVINGERRGAGAERARQRKTFGGGRPKRKGAVGTSKAKAIWKDPNLTVEEKVARSGWSKSNLYKTFGGTGRPAGWPKRSKA